jgi:hypothetical protein
LRFPILRFGYFLIFIFLFRWRFNVRGFGTGILYFVVYFCLLCLSCFIFIPFVQSVQRSKWPDDFPEETFSSKFLRVQGGLWGCFSNITTNKIFENFPSCLSKKSEKKRTELNTNQTKLNDSSDNHDISSAEDEESLLPINNNNINNNDL